eukprot:CAMPEP_0113427954 /NCGR_PEP_ID=MMETSP0013_2-20120614/31600_1 /TAXON_ID=2843 ORGANISM="Skeletonema costatum, Strain 1716" /NCGR_SAMPLE_ID=MMETSP0013_2 /ASSEMBLY_ACC=CAM_ASM_000158 /LENGTH=136 /DNA_ID=CAMNT_0000316461 /DNA_START=70 /DNA_END=476 /DNA_ORIENTATION=- /assembly_acc=CAM_ASM_000158
MPKATNTRTPHRHHNNRVVDVSRGSSALKRKDGRTTRRNGKAKSGTPSYSPINNRFADERLVNEEGDEEIISAAAIVRIREGVHVDSTQENDVRNIDNVEDGSTSEEDDLLSKYASFAKDSKEVHEEEDSGEEDSG